MHNIISIQYGTSYMYDKVAFTIRLLVSSADNLCKQFGPRSSLTEDQVWSGCKLLDTDGTHERMFWKNK